MDETDGTLDMATKTTVYDSDNQDDINATTTIGNMYNISSPEEFIQEVELVQNFLTNNETAVRLNSSTGHDHRNDYLKINREISQSNTDQHNLFWTMLSLVRDLLHEKGDSSEFMIPELFSVAKTTYGMKEGRKTGIVTMFIMLHNTYYHMDWDELITEYDNSSTDFSIRTMMHYASANPIFSEWHNIWVSEAYVYMIEKPNKISIAEFIYRLFPMDFITIEGTLYWLNPKKCCLNSADAVNNLYDIVRNTITSDNFIWPLSNGSRMSYKEMRESDQMQGEANGITLIRDFISTNRNDSNIVNVLKDRYSSKLSKQLDSDYRRTAWAGCVTYAGKDCIKFCEPKIEDYITKSTNVQIVSKNNTKYDSEVIEYLKSVYPEGLHISMMIDTAGMLEGVNTEHKAKFLLGEGRNGKSLWTDLLRYLFGDYFTQITTNTLKSSAGEGASPIMASCEGARVLVMPEANRDTPFDTSLFKSLTGNDHITARKLHKDARTFRAGFRLICPCQNPPDLEHDFAIKQRFLAIPFLGMWLPQENYNEREEEGAKMAKMEYDRVISKGRREGEDLTDEAKKIHNLTIRDHMKYAHVQDAQFGDKIKLWLGTIAKMLVHEYYPKYAKDRNTHDRYNHPLIKKETASRWNDNDPFARFVSEEYITSMGSRVLIKDMRDLFQEKQGVKGKSKDVKSLVKKLKDLGYGIEDGKYCMDVKRETSKGASMIFSSYPIPPMEQ